MGWNIQKWPFQRGVLLKNAFLFPELSFYFPELLFYFPEVLFCFTEVPFYFSKIPSFPGFPFSFPEVPLFMYCACLFPRMPFFPADCTFSLSCSELLREIIFALLLFFFSLGNLYGPTFDAFLITLAPLHGIWFIMHFIQILVSMIAWKMQFLSN